MIKACLNGGRSRDDHPAIPITPAELAAEGAAAVAAGAAALHLHVRGADRAETLEAEPLGATLEAVRAACPGVPVGVTTGLWVAGGDAARRLSLVEGWTGAARPDFASVNVAEEGADELAAALLARGIDIEAGVWSVADAGKLATTRFAGDLIRILVEALEQEPAAAVEVAAAIDAALEGLDAPRLHHGFGLATWTVIEAAATMGRDIRVGLEDTTVLPDGRTAAGNGELVAAAAELIRRASTR